MDDPEAVAIFGSVPAKRDVERCPISTPAVEALAWPSGPEPAYPLRRRPRASIDTPGQPTAVVMTALPEPVRPRTVSFGSWLGGVFDTSNSLRA